MISGFKVASLEKRRIDGLLSTGLGVLAAVVYGLTLSKGVFPGESARLMAVYSGVEPLDLPVHPVWGMIVSWLSTLSLFSLPLRLNLFSAVCSVISAVLMYRLMAFLVHDTIYEEYSVEYASRVSFWAGVVSSFALIFSVPIWQASTHLQYQSFDLMLALVIGNLLVTYAIHGGRIVLGIAAFLYGLCIVEASEFIPLGPVVLAFLIYVLWKRGELNLYRVTWLGVFAVLGLCFYYYYAKRFFDTHECASLGLKSVMDVMVAVWKSQVYQLKTGLPRVGWLILLMMSVVPWLAAGFASFRALNNERTWSQYILHFMLTVMVVLSLTKAPISPWELVKPLGRLPVFSYAMVAMVAGYLVAYWYLLLKVERPKRGQATSVLTKQAGDWLGLFLTYPLVAIVFFTAIVNAFECRGSRGAFADRCAKEILDRMNGRTWLVTDGTLDTHLLLMAKNQGKELNLLCLQNDMSQSYLKRMAQLIEAKKVFAPADLQRMKSTLDLGMLPFIQDWFAMDKEIEKKVAVFGVPDFWYTAGITPVSEFFFFSGCRDIQTLKGRPLLAEYMAFWKEMERVLPAVKGGLDDPTLRLRATLRRHMGFVANNLGVLLEDLGNDKDAFAVYTYVHSTIDPENISALFNRFEMARRGVAAASASKDAIERELNDFVKGVKQRYPMWSLSRYYGYVRSPEIFARLGWGWALSGQTGAALAGVNRAINLLPSDQRVGALHAMAAIYSLADDRNKTEAVYQDIIKSDPNNRTAMLGLARLAVQDGALEKAKAWLEKAAKSDDKRGTLGVEWAVIHLMNNDVARARLVLQETTDLQPKNLQAWAMLALVQMQQNEIEDVEKVLLPKMEKIAGTVDNYFLQITRAQVWMKKGTDLTAKKTAREAFIRAAMLRPDIPGVKDMILQLDIAMNDQSGAELHARQVLRTNRKHALANYVMGSLRLQEGSYGEAEDFLRRSVETNPSAAALNDLAEVLRRIKRFDDAEKYVRQAIKLNPDLYVSWETLASVLLESNKDLNEAESAIRKAESLFKDDLRVNITLARIQLKKGDIELARGTIRKVKSQQGNLSRFDQEELARVAEQAASGRSR
jgi:tetratricopeptide (TPR) repeat protein